MVTFKYKIVNLLFPLLRFLMMSEFLINCSQWLLSFTHEWVTVRIMLEQIRHHYEQMKLSKNARFRWDSTNIGKRFAASHSECYSFRLEEMVALKFKMTDH